MSTQFCNQRLKADLKLAQNYGSSMFAFSGLNLVFSLLAILGNVLVIRALWKASSISVTLKRLFLSLAFSDLAVGLFPQLLLGVTTVLKVKRAVNGNDNLEFLCPAVFNVQSFAFFLLACASFLNITAIAIDRLLTVSLHLRYQELVTSKRVIIALVSLWLTSGVAASIFILLPGHNQLVATIIEIAGLLLTAVAYFRVYKVVRYHQNQIQNQLQLTNAKAVELHRERKSAFNSLFVFVVFLACYLPNLCLELMLLTYGLQPPLLIAEQVTFFLVLLNSSLNPLVYCWRYREIREIVKSTVKILFRINC